MTQGLILECFQNDAVFQDVGGPSFQQGLNSVALRNEKGHESVQCDDDSEYDDRGQYADILVKHGITCGRSQTDDNPKFKYGNLMDAALSQKAETNQDHNEHDH